MGKLPKLKIVKENCGNKTAKKLFLDDIVLPASILEYSIDEDINNAVLTVKIQIDKDFETTEYRFVGC